MEATKRNSKFSLAWKGFILGIICISFIVIANQDNVISKQMSAVPDSFQGFQDSQIISKLTKQQATKIVDNVVQIAKSMLAPSNQNSQLNKEITHKSKSFLTIQLNGNVMIDPAIIQLIQKLPQVKQLIFEILDKNNNKEVTEYELSQTIKGIYQDRGDSPLIDAFTKELFQKINAGKNFTYTEFEVYFNSFLVEILKGNTNPFQNTPPFEKQDIKGLILYLASGRKIWDKCLYTTFKIMDKNNDKSVSLEEIRILLTSINQSTWDEASPYVSSILGYMRITGNATGDSFNLGQLITFGELIRPYMKSILDKYIN